MAGFFAGASNYIDKMPGSHYRRKVKALRYLLSASLALFVLLAACGCGDQVSSADIQQEITARAPELIGPAEVYRAEIRKADTGRIGEITIVAVGVKPDPNLVVDPLRLSIKGLEFSKQPFRILQPGTATFSGRISESAVNHFLRQQQRTGSGLLKNIRIEFQRGTARVSGSFSVLNVDIPLETTGSLQVVDGIRLHYKIDKLRVVGISVPPALPGLLTSLINPLVDLSGLRFTPNITRVTLEPGAVTVSGTAAVAGL